jgi:hypothetical protein
MRKIRIKLVESIVSPEMSSYRLISSDDVIKINVGFITSNTNIADLWKKRRWSITDISGNIVHQDIVDVELNTFNSYVVVKGSMLEMNTIYTFRIENVAPMNVNTSATISTLRNMNTVNEKSRFSRKPDVFGDIVTRSIIDSNTGTEFWEIRFRTDWDTMRTEGNGLAIGLLEGESLNSPLAYAYAPTKISTWDQHAPGHIDFIPFVGMPIMRVPVYRIPVIKHVRNFVYSIDPPARILVEWRKSLRQVETFSYETRSEVSVIDVEEIAKDYVSSVYIRSV